MIEGLRLQSCERRGNAIAGGVQVRSLMAQLLDGLQYLHSQVKFIMNISPNFKICKIYFEMRTETDANGAIRAQSAHHRADMPMIGCHTSTSPMLVSAWVWERMRGSCPSVSKRTEFHQITKKLLKDQETVH